MGGSWTVRQGQSSSNKNFATIQKKYFAAKTLSSHIFKSLSKVVWSCRRHLHGKWCAQTEPKTPKANLSPNCTWCKSRERFIPSHNNFKRDNFNQTSLTTSMVNRWSWSGSSGEVGSYWRTCPGEQLVTWVDDNQDLHVMGGGDNYAQCSSIVETWDCHYLQVWDCFSRCGITSFTFRLEHLGAGTTLARCYPSHLPKVFSRIWW